MVVIMEAGVPGILKSVAVINPPLMAPTYANQQNEGVDGIHVECKRQRKSYEHSSGQPGNGAHRNSRMPMATSIAP